ncbi:DUF4007 family protein [Meiothermus cerbereus]|uniref:DUF4007 family protein n=1 Tax=Meiothermus cerbereus TaxID=65552 RepID=UPI0004889E2F|nr:DUF4007 family protein [Meiothermus cerbereus]
MATNQAQSLNHNSLERFGFSGHETFPFRYGWLKKAVDAVTKNKFLFSTEQALVELGVGKNMVQSIRHWGLATQVLLEGEGRSLEVSPIGWRLFKEWDPHLENPASLWLIHWLLVNNPAKAGVWHLAFTRFTQPDLTKGQLLTFLLDFKERQGLRVQELSLRRDIDCFLRTYQSRADGKGPLEDSFDCPLTELGLLSPLKDGEGYRFAIGPKPTLPAEIVGYALLEYMRRIRSGRNSISFAECLYGLGSPGQVFKLDENSLVEYLEDLETASEGALELDDTAGLKQLYRRRDFDGMELLQRYYGTRI